MDETGEMMTAPIPGMSLTTEPGNRPWENPPKMVDVDEVIEYYIPRLSDSDRADQLMLLLEQDIAVNFLVDSMITTGAMKGLHTMESGMLAAPVLSEIIMAMAELEGIEYTESYAELRKKKASPALVARAMELIEKEDSPFKDEPATAEEKEDEKAEEPKRKGIAILATTTAPVAMTEEVTEDGV